jgi:hypothetical protein
MELVAELVVVPLKSTSQVDPEGRPDSVKVTAYSVGPLGARKTIGMVTAVPETTARPNSGVAMYPGTTPTE